MSIPQGWDTIPMITLEEKYSKLSLDAGIYSVDQDSNYFNRYVLLQFIPTQNTLDAMSFEQIEAELVAVINQSSLISDSLLVRVDSIQSNNREGKYWINSYLSILKDTTKVNSCQTLIITKYGYISVLMYEKSDRVLLLKNVDDFIDNLHINIGEDYIYTPSKDKSFPINYLLISLCIGIAVYVIIVKLSNKRK